jgi:hypothetical protein
LSQAPFPRIIQSDIGSHGTKTKAQSMARRDVCRDKSQSIEPLGRPRDGWKQVEAEETCLLRRLTTEEGLHDLLCLQTAFEPQPQRTESLFRAERLAYLQDLQEKLSRLAEWMKGQRGRAV